LENLLKKRIVLLDGATGTNLFNMGLEPGEPPAILNLKNPDAVYELQKRYVESGSDAILTNTFSANPLNFKKDEYKDIIRAGIKIALRAAGSKKRVIGDIGPLGLLMKPYGEGNFDEVYRIYLEIFRTFSKCGVKIFLIETFNSLIEAKAAFLAAKNYAEDIFVSFTFQDNLQTIWGELPESIAITFESLGAKGVGVNCTAPEVAVKVLERMGKVTNLPLIAKPNAGKVKIAGGKFTHSLSDEILSGYLDKFIHTGARLIGGCCGTTPEYIKLISKRVPIQNFKKKMEKKFYLASSQSFIEVDNNTTVVVGERLNPSGRKKIKEALIKKDYAIYGKEAKLQEQSGADALDLNVFVPEVNEGDTLLNCLYEVLKNSKLPVFIDTQNFSAAKRAMEIYPGIGVYNSIPARRRELKKFLPAVKKYGFKAVISLIGKKVPRSFEERRANLKLVFKVAKKLNFPTADLIFDPLVFSVATEVDQIEETLKTIQFLHQRGLKTILGISNVSFGLPGRSLLNSALLTLSVKAGANFLILNPLDRRVMESYYAIKGITKNKINEYIRWIKEKGGDDFGLVNKEETKKSFSQKEEVKGRTREENLINAIINGESEIARQITERMLDSGESYQKIVNQYIFEAMSEVGKNYELGRFFIPDLLKAAEATKAVLRVVKKTMEKIENKGEQKKVILATVKGDIHDIGKNIVAMVLESAGYKVIDLGKDVDAKKIVEAVKKHQPLALGLSALLTTTMPEMENVIKLLRRRRLDTPVIIGGPNVSAEFARRIGACAAVQNAFDGLKVLRKIDAER